MYRTSDEQGQDQDNVAEDAHADPTMHRRRLLGEAGAGLALAASGLFLPAWLAESAAREGALGGARGGRHGKNRRGRHRKRRLGDSKNKGQDKPRGGGNGATKLAFIVKNSRAVPVQVQGWDMNQAGSAFINPDGWDWSTLPAFPTDGPSLPPTKEFSGNSIQVAVRIGTNRLVYGLIEGWAYYRNDEIIDVNIRTGGWDSKGWNPRGSLRADSDGIAVGQSTSADGIKITRLPNSASHVLFSVDLT